MRFTFCLVGLYMASICVTLPKWNNEHFSYQLMSMSGMVLDEGTGNDFVEIKFVEIKNEHSKGVYLLKVHQGDNSKIFKVIKE